jgi:zinc transport system substrate-binding protein
VLSRTVLFCVAVAGVLGAAGCGGDAGGAEESIVAAFYPLAYAAEQVAAPGTPVVDLTPPGAEPHDLELSARDVERVRDAALVVYAGNGFQPAVEDAVAGRQDPSLDVLETGKGGDPHVGLDPRRVAGVARSLAAALGRPGAAQPLVERLEALDTELEQGLRRCERREIVTSHAAFSSLAERYGLVQVPLTGLSPEAEPGARDIEHLVGEVRETGATTVFVEPLVSPRLAETVAREAGATTAVLDPLEGLSQARLDAGADYVGVMRENLAALRAALGCR